MSSSKPTALKTRLVSAGFEIFRVRGNQIRLADRVRENLIMDSGVSAVAGERLAVRIILKAQANQFPGESEAQLFERARKMAGPLHDRGYVEVEATVVPVDDPGGGDATLDTWYELAWERAVDESELAEELRYALALEKTAE